MTNEDPLKSIYEDDYGTSLDPTEEEQEIEQEEERRSQTEDAHTITFTGFASSTPFLVEKPSHYIDRLSQAAQALIITPDGDTEGPGTRVLYSPALSLPFLLPQEGDKMYEHSRHYPLLNLPEGRPYDDPELPIDAYALAVIVAYEMQDVNFMGEPGDGDLLTWDDIVRYAVPDKYWSKALEVTEAIYQPLIALNLARLVRFSQPDQHERQQLATLCKAWQVTDTPATLIENGDRALPVIKERWESIAPDKPFDPYK